MAQTKTLQLFQPEPTDNPAQDRWGRRVNANFDIIDYAINGIQTVQFTGTNTETENITLSRNVVDSGNVQSSSGYVPVGSGTPQASYASTVVIEPDPELTDPNIVYSAITKVLSFINNLQPSEEDASYAFTFTVINNSPFYVTINTSPETTVLEPGQHLIVRVPLSGDITARTTIDKNIEERFVQARDTADAITAFGTQLDERITGLEEDRKIWYPPTVEREDGALTITGSYAEAGSIILPGDIVVYVNDANLASGLPEDPPFALFVATVAGSITTANGANLFDDTAQKYNLGLANAFLVPINPFLDSRIIDDVDAAPVGIYTVPATAINLPEGITEQSLLMVTQASRLIMTNSTLCISYKADGTFGDWQCAVLPPSKATDSTPADDNEAYTTPAYVEGRLKFDNLSDKGAVSAKDIEKLAGLADSLGEDDLAQTLADADVPVPADNNADAGKILIVNSEGNYELVSRVTDLEANRSLNRDISPALPEDYEAYTSVDLLLQNSNRPRCICQSVHSSIGSKINTVV